MGKLEKKGMCGKMKARRDESKRFDTALEDFSFLSH